MILFGLPHTLLNNLLVMATGSLQKILWNFRIQVQCPYGLNVQMLNKEKGTEGKFLFLVDMLNQFSAQYSCRYLLMRQSVIVKSRKDTHMVLYNSKTLLKKPKQLVCQSTIKLMKFMNQVFSISKFVFSLACTQNLFTI